MLQTGDKARGSATGFSQFARHGRALTGVSPEHAQICLLYTSIYYEEAEKQNKEVQKLKHDMKHKLHELYHLVENSDGQELDVYKRQIFNSAINNDNFKSC